MQQVLSVLLAIERIVITFAAVLAIFPLLQWWEERDDRTRDRLSNVMQMVQICERFYDDPNSFSSLATFDVYEDLCGAATAELSEWVEEYYYQLEQEFPLHDQ